jgi:hypothetical protein
MLTSRETNDTRTHPARRLLIALFAVVVSLMAALAAAPAAHAGSGHHPDLTAPAVAASGSKGRDGTGLTAGLTTGPAMAHPDNDRKQGSVFHDDRVDVRPAPAGAKSFARAKKPPTLSAAQLAKRDAFAKRTGLRRRGTQISGGI